MTRRIQLCVVVALVATSLTVLASPASAAPTGYTIQSIEGDDLLYTIDMANGDTTLIGDTGLDPSTRGLAIAPDGTLYGANDGSLYTLDTATGTATLVGPFGCCGNVEAMAFNSAGDLWLVSGNPSSLYSVSPATGAATEVGPIDRGLISGLAANCEGTIYGTDGDDDDLIAIDPATADATTVGDFGVDVGSGALSYDDGGELWMLLRPAAPPGAPSQTWTVDPATGAGTQVAPTVSGNNPSTVAVGLLDCPEPPTTTSTTTASTSTTVRPATPAARAVATVPRFTG